MKRLVEGGVKRLVEGGVNRLVEGGVNRLVEGGVKRHLYTAACAATCIPPLSSPTHTPPSSVPSTAATPPRRRTRAPRASAAAASHKCAAAARRLTLRDPQHPPHTKNQRSAALRVARGWSECNHGVTTVALVRARNHSVPFALGTGARNHRRWEPFCGY